jgi:predicted transposase/invertase (TIGR01784 family)
MPTAREVIQVFIDAFPDKRDQFMTCAEELINEGMQKGIQQGILTGMERGIVRGMELGIQQIAKKMLVMGIALNVILEVTGLPKKTLEALMESDR